MEADSAFGRLVAGLDYPMFVVTAATGGVRDGCLVGFATQASIDPPRLLVAISRANRTFEVAAEAEGLVVHFLRRDNDDLARLFGEETGDTTDKFTRCEWDDGPFGAPVVRGTRGWVAGRILARLDGGDHVAHLVDVERAELGDDGPQLGYQAVRGLDPGHPA